MPHIGLPESAWEFHLGVSPWEGIASQGSESFMCCFMLLREVAMTRTGTVSDPQYTYYVPSNGIHIFSPPPNIASPCLKYKGQRGSIWTLAQVQLHGTWHREPWPGTFYSVSTWALALTKFPLHSSFGKLKGLRLWGAITLSAHIPVISAGPGPRYTMSSSCLMVRDWRCPQKI